MITKKKKNPKHNKLCDKKTITVTDPSSLLVHLVSCSYRF